MGTFHGVIWGGVSSSEGVGGGVCEVRPPRVGGATVGVHNECRESRRHFVL